VGSGGEKIIPITSGNSSLQGVARAINSAGAGVTASVINDGTGSPFRLILQSTTTGAANAITVSATDDNAGDGADLATLFTGMSTLAAADDAEITLGNGGGALTLTKSSNTVTDVIPGVTLNLLEASSGPVSIVIGRDTTEATKEITGFVDSLNAAITYLGENTKYDSTTRSGGILLSETGLRRGLTDLTRRFSAADPSLPSGMNSVASIGITVDRTKGSFTIDKAVLAAKLAEDPEGVAKLFGNSGTSTAGGVEFAALGEKTVAKNFAVEITAPAAQARATPLGAIVADGGGNVVIGSGNKTLSLTVNEQVYSATLTEGTYTRDQLAAHVQQAVNSQISRSSDLITACCTCAAS